MPEVDDYYLIFNCTVVFDTDTGTSTIGQLWINKSTLHATIGTQDLKVVSANPTLDGTEASLTSIKIGNTNYAVGGGGSHLYEHNICVSGVATLDGISRDVYVRFTILSTSDAVMTKTDTQTYLRTNHSLSYPKMATVVISPSYTTAMYGGICVSNTSSMYFQICRQVGFYDQLSNTSAVDDVKTII